MFARLGRILRGHSRIAFLLAILFVFGTAAAVLQTLAQRRWRDAHAALRAGRAEDAREPLRFCLRVWPRNLTAHLAAVRAARLDDDLPTARALLERCRELGRGDDPDIAVEALLIRVHAGEGDALAPTLLSSVQQSHPQTPLILEALARHYMSHLRHQRAFACLSYWIEKEPDAALPYQGRGWVQERLNNLGAALDDYNAALARDADLFPARLRVASILLDDHRVLEALPHLEYLQRRHGGRVEVVARLGQCRLLQGELEEARRLLEAAAAERPRDPAILLRLARLELQEGHGAAAEAVARRLLDAAPTDAQGLQVLADSQRQQGKDAEAAATKERLDRTRALIKKVQELLKGEALAPSAGPRVPSEAGATLLSLGEERVGLYWLHQALERDPSHGPSHRALAAYYDQQGDAEAAARHRRLAAPPP